MAARVMFVDDDVVTLALMDKATHMLGHEPILKCSAQAAMDSARMDRPNFILVDLNLPEMDGLELIRQLHANSETATIPTLIISVSIQPEVKEKACQVGADACLEKPLSLETLARLIKKYSKSRRSQGMRG